MKRLSMVRLFSLMFIALILAPFLIMTVVLNHQYSDLIMNYETETLEKEITEVSKNLEEQISNAIYLGAGLTVTNQSKILQYVSKYLKSENSGEKYDLNLEINEMINYLVSNSKNKITSINFYKSPQSHYEYGTIYHASERIDPGWYEDTLKRNGKPYVINPVLGDKTYSDYLSVGFKVNEENNYGIQVILVTIKTSVFQDMYSDYQNDPYKQICIFGDHHHAVFSCGMDQTSFDSIAPVKENEKILGMMIHNRSKYVISKPILKASWDVVTIVDYSGMTKPVREMALRSLMLVGFCVVLFSFFAYVFFKRIMIPISKVANHMSVIQNGNLIEMPQCKGNFEMQKLIQSFNIMICELRHSIEERDRQQKEKSYMEIKVLQSQIMPHFVINTLNSIKLLAVINRQDNIAKMSGAFMKLLDATLNRTGDFITVQEELGNIENYIYIMKFRYGDNFQYKIVAEEQVRACKILRLLLQPVVENAIIHAFREMTEEGCLSISIRRAQDTIVISVKDNGAGMTAEQVSNLLSNKTEDNKRYSHIGINNVNQRVKLHYGEAYGISIYSSLGSGTEVVIVYPFEKEGNDFDKGTDRG